MASTRQPGWHHPAMMRYGLVGRLIVRLAWPSVASPGTQPARRHNPAAHAGPGLIITLQAERAELHSGHAPKRAGCTELAARARVDLPRFLRVHGSRWGAGVVLSRPAALALLLLLLAVSNAVLWTTAYRGSLAYQLDIPPRSRPTLQIVVWTPGLGTRPNYTRPGAYPRPLVIMLTLRYGLRPPRTQLIFLRVPMWPVIPLDACMVVATSVIGLWVRCHRPRCRCPTRGSVLPLFVVDNSAIGF